jgi:hypothetical protein
MQPGSLLLPGFPKNPAELLLLVKHEMERSWFEQGAKKSPDVLSGL